MQRAQLSAFLAAYGLTPERVQRVAQLDCDVYRIATSDASRRDLSLRIYPATKHDLAPIAAEVAWLSALAAEGVHVPRPLPDEQGRLIRPWHADQEATPRHTVLLTWLHGRMHDRGLTPERLRRVGTMTAQLHRSAARLTQAGAIATGRLAHDTDLARWTEAHRPGSPRLPSVLRDLTQAAARRLLGDLAAFPQDSSAFGFIHGDLHPWNILFVRDVAGAIDFSDCGCGHFAMDLAASLQYLKLPLADNFDHRPQYARLHDSLLEGYADVRALPHGVERQIEILIVARLFMTLEWILDDWPAPDHRAWGPGFLLGLEPALRGYLAG
ncbi:MAG: phosphotransferase [Burkholderiales bacterium]